MCATSQHTVTLAAIEKAIGGQPLTTLKALAYIARGDVTVLRGSEAGIRLLVRGSRREPYTVRYGRVAGVLVQECDCDASQASRATCSHIRAARLLWRE